MVPLDQDAGVVAWWGFHLWLGGDRAALVLLRWRPNICAERIGGQGWFAGMLCHLSCPTTSLLHTRLWPCLDHLQISSFFTLFPSH